MKRQNNILALLLLVFLACAAIIVAYLFLPHAQAGNAYGGGEITIKLDGSPYVSGSTAYVRAVSTCGDFKIFLDGENIGGGAPYFESPLLLTQGRHLLLAQSGSCISEFHFEAIARECSGNQTRQCDAGGCSGIRRCENGIYSKVCTFQKKVCVPGERIGCSTDGCKFGYAICNPCGTGFGKCGDGGAAIGSNSSPYCDDGGCS
jgi:hypothetical protein